MIRAKHEADTVGTETEADGLGFGGAAADVATEAEGAGDALFVAADIEAASFRIAEEFDPFSVGVKVGLGGAKDVTPRRVFADGKGLSFALDECAGLPLPEGIAGVVVLECAVSDGRGVRFKDGNAVHSFEENMVREKLSDGNKVLAWLQVCGMRMPVPGLARGSGKAL